MNKTLLFCVSLFAAVSCSKTGIIEEEVSHRPSFECVIEEGSSKVQMDADGKLSWTEGDRISVFNGDDMNLPCLFDGHTGDRNGTFTSQQTHEAGAGGNIAFYPYDASTYLSGNEVHYKLPEQQIWREDNFSDKACPMIACTASADDTQLHFKNVCGFIEFNLYAQPGTRVRAIRLKSERKLSGWMTASIEQDSNVSVSMSESAYNHVELLCPEGVSVGESAQTAIRFIVAVPFGEIPAGLQIDIDIEKDSRKTVMTRLTKKALQISRSEIKPIGAFEVKEEIPYVTFWSEQSAKLGFEVIAAGLNLQYSLNGADWTEIGQSEIVFGSTAGAIRLRGKCSQGTGNGSGWNQFKLPVSQPAKVYCYGDIRTLVDWENYKSAPTSEVQFFKLFANCSTLVTAPDLPSLTLAEACYQEMFSGCTSLIEAPELPATTLAAACYQGMFSGCTSLIEAPELPATTLASKCYQGMFSGCSSLIEAPVLPAPTLVTACYKEMFKDCTKLSYVKALFTDIDRSAYVENWLSGVAQSGTFVSGTDAVWKSDDKKMGYVGVPSGWVIE